MFKRTDREWLRDIQEAIHRISAYTAGMTFATFLADSRTQDAVIRNVEIIGEATKNLSERVREKYQGVPWKHLARVRDRLIHHYFGVNLDVVWQIVTTELPVLASEIERIVCEESA